MIIFCDGYDHYTDPLVKYDALFRYYAEAGYDSWVFRAYPGIGRFSGGALNIGRTDFNDAA